MKKYFSYMIIMLLLCVVATACNGDIGIKQDYGFSVTHLPVPKKLKAGEVAEIRCTLHRDGEYADTRYYLRFFQYDGEGQLWMDGGNPFLPNDTYEVKDTSFRLYFRSMSEEAHNLEIVFFDNQGKEYPLELSFQNDSDREDNG